MNILTLLEQSGIQTKRVAGTHGGEWAGPCPLCGGRDRFRIWPTKGEGGAWWCRRCGRGGDCLQFLRDVRGLSFREACSFLGREPGARRPRPAATPRAETWTPRTAALPAETWREKAGDFLTRAEATLAGIPEALRWLLEERGLTASTVKAARLGWNPKDLFLDRAAWGLPEERNTKGDVKRLWLPAGLVIPSFADGGDLFRVKVRRPGKDDPRYVHVSGGSSRTWILANEAACYVVVESELDGLLLQQEARGLCGVVILGSAQARPDQEATARLRAAEVVLVALDADKAGAKEAWAWWSRHFPKARRWPVVRGKDVTEMWKAGLPIREWILAGIEPCKPVAQRVVLPVVQRSVSPVVPEDPPERGQVVPEAIEPEDPGTEPDNRTAGLLAQLDGLSLPAIPFRLRRGETVVASERFLAGLRHDIQTGPRGPRARTWALWRDLDALRGILGDPQRVQKSSAILETQPNR